jgi:choline dehydrogenase-like flavoprotein
MGLKYESLWADPSIMLVKWGGFGADFLRRLAEVPHATVGAVVYRGKCTGTVRPNWDGSPSMKLWIPDSEAQTVFRACKLLADGLLKSGARYVFAGNIPGVEEEMRTPEHTEALLSTKLRAKHLSMTGNHVFGTVRMTGSDRTGPISPDGRVRGTEGLWVTDASIFPSPSAVNPQATVMALADVISRRIGDLAA